MSPRRNTSGLGGTPALVGAVTLLVAMVAVFISYNAHSGLPFVPNIKLKANLPNAQQLVEGFEVRVGGARIGAVSKIEPKQRDDGSSYAEVTLKLDRDLGSLPVDSTLLVRPRSSIGLKYVEVTPGDDAETFEDGATIPIRQARPQPVEIDDVLNAFDDRARVGIRGTLQGYGNALAGRGRNLNTAIEELSPLLDDVAVVARDLAAPQARLDRFVAELGDTTAELAPVAEESASLVVNLDTSFAALASVARPFLQDTITEGAETEELVIREFPRMRPFVRDSAALFRELAPGAAALPATAPVLADAFEKGADVLPDTPPFNRDLADTFDALAEFSEDPLVEVGIGRLTRLNSSLRPTLDFLAPAQTVCNYAALLLRNLASSLADGDANGNWQRASVVIPFSGPNSENGPSDGAADGPLEENHLHFNAYPNTAAPGQPRECEAGNEHYAPGEKVIGNTPENDGTGTDDQAGGGP